MKSINQSEKAFIGTYTGKKFFLLEPKLEDIDIVDIAHALAMQCRWTGHVRYHYSVAQHSYYCSFIGSPDEALERLMHDASEAYMGDMNRPLKHYTDAGPAYRRQESVVQAAICNRFGITLVEPPSVHFADQAMLYAEKAQLMDRCSFEEAEKWTPDEKPADILIEQWGPNHAESMFLLRFNELYNRRIN